MPAERDAGEDTGGNELLPRLRGVGASDLTYKVQHAESAPVLRAVEPEQRTDAPKNTALHHLSTYKKAAAIDVISLVEREISRGDHHEKSDPRLAPSLYRDGTPSPPAVPTPPPVAVAKPVATAPRSSRNKPALKVSLPRPGPLRDLQQAAGVVAIAARMATDGEASAADGVAEDDAEDPAAVERRRLEAIGVFIVPQDKPAPIRADLSAWIVGVVGGNRASKAFLDDHDLHRHWV